MEMRPGNNAPWIAHGASAPPMTDHHFVHHTPGMAAPTSLSVGWGAVVTSLLLDQLLPMVKHRLGLLYRRLRRRIRLPTASRSVAVKGEGTRQETAS